MTALTADRNTHRRTGESFSFPVAASVTCYAGGIAVLDSAGNCKPAVTATGLIAVGCFIETVANGATAAAVNVNVERGIFRYANSADSDAITKAEVGDVCYLVDDQTVAKTHGSGTRSPAGLVVDVDSGGVWVQIGCDSLLSPATALLAANNLSDVGAAATARANLGVNKLWVPIDVVTLVGTNVYYAVAPIAGTITKIRSVIEGVLTTGDATLTGKINGAAITNGVITITQSGSAAGDTDSATPSAAHTVAAGDAISLTVGGTNATASRARCLVEITY